MFEIILNNETLDLAPGQEITLTAISNYFQNKIEYDGSELIRFSLTPKNLRAFGHIDVLEVDISTISLDCFLRLRGNTFTAILKLQAINTNISGYLLYNAAELSCLNKNIKEFDWEVPTATISAQFKQGTEQFWPNTPFYFPSILNPAFYDELDVDPAEKKNPHFQGIINQSIFDTAQHVPVPNYTFGLVYHNINTLVPMVPVLEIFRRALLIDGYKLSGEWPNTAVMAKLFMYNGYSLDYYGNNLLATATNTGSLMNSFNNDKLNFNATTNPTLFNVALDQYEITEEGNYRIELRFSLPQHVLLPGATVDLYEGATKILSEALSGGDYSGGQYIFYFFRSYGFIDIGTKVWFKLNMPAPKNTTVSNLQLIAQKLIGTSLIQYKAVTNLQNHLPNRQFSEVLDAFFTAFQLTHYIDRQEKVFYINYKKSGLQANNPVAVGNNVAAGVNAEITEPQSFAYGWKQTIKWQDLKDITVARTAIYSINGTIQIADRLDAALAQSALQPDIELLQKVLIDHPNYSALAYTLYIERQGTSQPMGLVSEKEEDIYIGLHLGNISGNILAGHQSGTLNLTLAANTQSVLQYITPWLQYLQKSVRRFIFTIPGSHKNASAISAQRQISIRNQIFLPEEITQNLSTTKAGSIEVKCRKV